MNSRSRIIIGIAGLLLLLCFAYFFQDVVVYLIVASVLSLMGRPIMRLLSKVRVREYVLPNSIKAILTLLTLFGIAVLFFVIFVPVIVGQIQKIESIDVDSIARSLQEPINYLEAKALEYHLTDENVSAVEYFQSKTVSVLSSVKFSNIANAVIGFTGDFFIALFSISFITFFFLKDQGMVSNIIITIAPSGYEERVEKIILSVKNLLTRYFIGVLTEVLLVGGLISLGLWIIGVENAATIGFMAGIFNVIPYLGPILGALMGISLTILSSLGLEFYTEMVPLILKVAVVFLVVQLIDNFVFQPFIYSSSVKAHPLEIFLVILMAGSFAGIGGMILAIPTYTVLRVIAKEFLNQFKVVRSITKSI